MHTKTWWLFRWLVVHFTQVSTARLTSKTLSSALDSGCQMCSFSNPIDCALLASNLYHEDPTHTHTLTHVMTKYRWQLCLLYWIYIPPPMANIARSNGLADQKLCRVLLSSVWSNIMNYQFIFSLVAHKSTSYYTCQLPYCFGCMLAVLVHSAMRCSVLVVCVCSWSIFVCWWSRWPNE